MTTLLRKMLVVLFLNVCIFVSAAATGVDRSSLKDLDAVLKDRNKYERQGLRRIEVIKSLLMNQTDEENVFLLNSKLAEEYEVVNYDSSMTYYRNNLNLARSLNDSSKLMGTRLMLARLAAKQYFLAQAYNYANVVEPRFVDQYDSLKCLYNQALNDISLCVMENTVDTTVYNDELSDRVSRRQLLLSYATPGTKEWLYIKMDGFADAHQSDSAKAYAEKLVAVYPPMSHRQAYAYYKCAVFSKNEGEKMDYLIKSAIADVKSGSRNYDALIALSQILGERGRVTKAFKYLTEVALPGTLAYGGRRGALEISKVISKLSLAYTNHWRIVNRLGFVLCVLAAGFIVFLFYVTRRVRKRNRILSFRNKELIDKNNVIAVDNVRASSAARDKQEFLSHFMIAMTEIIASKRKEFEHKSAEIGNDGSHQTLEEMVKTFLAYNYESQIFHNVFDTTFLSMYPDFVKKFSALLPENYSVMPKASELLSPKLRIFAMIRLGIKDSSVISKLLGYSANTVYNYRAEVKAKSTCGKDLFESKVMEIE